MVNVCKPERTIPVLGVTAKKKVENVWLVISDGNT
jgi:hypothetical protein